jgi:hypothetical protein
MGTGQTEEPRADRARSPPTYEVLQFSDCCACRWHNRCHFRRTDFGTHPAGRLRVSVHQLPVCVSLLWAKGSPDLLLQCGRQVLAQIGSQGRRPARPVVGVMQPPRARCWAALVCFLGVWCGRRLERMGGLRRRDGDPRLHARTFLGALTSASRSKRSRHDKFCRWADPTSQADLAVARGKQKRLATS